MSLDIEGIPNSPAKLTADQVEKKFGDQINHVLKTTFGHDSFRAPQRDIVLSFLGGHDCFVLMPTGGGKSLGFQLPALIFPGITIVVSPLKALMQNQVDSLISQGIPAASINSSMSEKQREVVKADLKLSKPKTKLLYVTPELLKTQFMSILKLLNSRGLLSSVVIDEAHAVSVWGHGFRPAYKDLSCLKQNFPQLPIMACTATATDKVQSDITSILGLKSPKRFLSSFNRPNISYQVRYKDLIPDVNSDIISTINMFIKGGQPAGIVYCHKRQECEEIASLLKQHSISAAPYHAGLNDKIRETVLNEWISGKINVVIATIAFGMGIDNPRVRYVIHYSLPKSLEDFYQESGRAGRDGKESVSILYYSSEDKGLRRFLITKDLPSADSISSNPPSDLKYQQLKVQSQLTAFDKLVEYCEKPSCRRRMLLQYFGEYVSASEVAKVCHKTCDYCLSPGKINESLTKLSQFGSQSSFSTEYSSRKFRMHGGISDEASPDLTEGNYRNQDDDDYNNFYGGRKDSSKSKSFKSREEDEDEDKPKKTKKLSFMERFEAGFDASGNGSFKPPATKTSIYREPKKIKTSNLPTTSTAVPPPGPIKKPAVRIGLSKSSAPSKQIPSSSTFTPASKIEVAKSTKPSPPPTQKTIFQSWAQLSKSGTSEATSSSAENSQTFGAALE